MNRFRAVLLSITFFACGVAVAKAPKTVDTLKVVAKNRKKFVLGHFALNQPYFEKKIGGVVLPKGFLKGVSYSTYQNGGHKFWDSLGYKPESNWTWFEKHKKQMWRPFTRENPKRKFGVGSASPIDRGEEVGISAAGWHHMFDDIKLMKDLGVNSLRFELPWTDLNPKKGVWNEEAFALFDKYIDALIANGITPMITLYHWVHPLWFHKLGGWEKQQNIRYYLEYVKRAVNRFGDRVKYWNTINEPTVISACGYILGSHAPGEQGIRIPGLPRKARDNSRFIKAGEVLFNLFVAHCDAYELIKSLPNGKDSKVSIVHQMSRFDRTSVQAKFAKKEMNRMFAHKTFMKFFKTGIFEYPLPKGTLAKFDERGPNSFDFVGLNFYAPVTLTPDPGCMPGETMTDMVWAIRPHGLYKGIKELSELGKPVIITENGIPDGTDDRRAKWIVGYSNALKRALDEGYDVQGFYYWSLLDNYEWNMGHNRKFGLYKVNTKSPHLKDKKRTLREGSKEYINYFRLPEF